MNLEVKGNRLEEKVEENSRPKREELALWSPALTILAVLLLIISNIFGLDDTPLFFLIMSLLIVLPILGFVYGIVSYRRIDKSKGKYYGKFFSGLGIIVPIVIFSSIMIPHRCPSRELAERIICQNNLRQMGIAMYLYSNDNQNFPKAD